MARERSIMRWIRQKWAEIRGDRITILNHLSVPSSALYTMADRLPYSTNLLARPPVAPTGEWTYAWRWLTPPIRGVTLEHPDSAYTTLRLEADAEVGVLGRIELVGWCDGIEYRSDPYAIQVLPA